jgi:large-conductance mechanosensitive channel
MPEQSFGKMRSLMANSDEAIVTDSNHIKIKVVITVLLVIGFFIVGFYFFNFHNGFSKENGVWGTFSDYVGGILNPIIAAFAFYLIAKTYELQQKELKELTDAQKKQITLAALTALLNSNLMRISTLEAEKLSLLESELRNPPQPKKEIDTTDLLRRELYATHERHIKGRKDYIKDEISELTKKNAKLEEQIENFSKEEIISQHFRL